VFDSKDCYTPFTSRNFNTISNEHFVTLLQSVIVLRFIAFLYDGGIPVLTIRDVVYEGLPGMRAFNKIIFFEPFNGKKRERIFHFHAFFIQIFVQNFYLSRSLLSVFSSLSMSQGLS